MQALTPLARAKVGSQVDRAVMIRVITRAIEGLSAKLRAKLTYRERLRAKDRPIPHLRP